MAMVELQGTVGAATQEAKRALFNIKKPLDDLTKAEAVAECEYWRRLWSWIPANVQGLVSKVGQEIVVYTRDGKTITGWYAGAELMVDTHSIRAQVVRYDQLHSKRFVEEGFFSVSESNITGMQFIEQRADFDEPKPETE